MVVYKEMPNQIGMDNTEDKTVMIVLIDIVIFIALFLNIIFSAIIFAISVNYIDNDIDRIFAILRVIPFSFIYIINASSLILQDKLNNIWKKAYTI